ncbi:unnamed protein product [Rotaria sp. Silwood2]|nr:unnamed protein product [Rotaria sp. Silwood2]CAF2996219.1 unnamed protein product [Rotaria sp. Silwood2]CAF4069054.1 unnamed protein product [Rotaria sp. Silwood2]CAF4094318.1 unnamed protein product [Rotaria sp. Silwood2]
MLKDHRITTISSIVSLASNENGIELNDTRTSNDNHSIGLHTSCFREKCNSITSCFHQLVKRLACLNLEQRGSERISPEDRTDLTIINTAIIWISANLIIPCFAGGTLGPAVFKLSLYDSFATIIFFNLLGTIPVAAMACFGPASGLRTMIFSRYSWGYYGASIISISNVIASIGWAAVNSITGAQTLRVVFNDSLPIAVGIIIIAIISMIVSFIGYKWIHAYERYSWIPVFIGYCILAGVGAKYFTNSGMVSYNTTIPINSSHRLKVSRILSFGATCFGASISWCACSADYNTYFPEDTSQLKIFLLTYFGNLLSMIPIQLLGAATYTGTYTSEKWNRAYEKNNVGGLLGASLSSLGGFGKFLLILFALSTIACNIPNIYSLSLSAQVIAPIFKRIPRFLYTVIGTALYILLAIVAASKFNDSLASIMGVSSYWFAIFIVIVFEDHLFFRRCSFKNYNFDIWDSYQLLPISLAAILSGIVGIVGIILGMSQTWFNGPIAKAIARDTDAQDSENSIEEIEPLTNIFWLQFYLAQHYDYLSDINKAFGYIDQAICDISTLVELYMYKTKIFKHVGDYQTAASWVDEAQSLDTADPYVNCKCTQYFLRANHINTALEIAEKFIQIYIHLYDYPPSEQDNDKNDNLSNIPAGKAKKLKNKLRKQQEKQKQIEDEQRRKEFQHNRYPGTSEFDETFRICWGWK